MQDREHPSLSELCTTLWPSIMSCNVIFGRLGWSILAISLALQSNHIFPHFWKGADLSGSHWPYDGIEILTQINDLLVRCKVHSRAPGWTFIIKSLRTTQQVMSLRPAHRKVVQKVECLGLHAYRLLSCNHGISFINQCFLLSYLTGRTSTSTAYV